MRTQDHHALHQSNDVDAPAGQSNDVDAPAGQSNDVDAPVGRALRARKHAQLNPFSHERVKYLSMLVRNDWQDAVVIERQREETDEDRQRKRARLELQRPDDLGWLA